MKFLCISCDEPMKITKAVPPDEGGSITAIFDCPTCSHQIAMLTNPFESQMVQSLGVKIGPKTEANPHAVAEPHAAAAAAVASGAAPESLAAEAAAGGCPFAAMLGDQEALKQDQITWTAEALARLENIPEFVRPMAKQGVEHYAKTNGHAVVDDAVMQEARGRFGM